MKSIQPTPIKRWLALAGIACAIPLSALAYPGQGGMAGCDGSGPKAGHMMPGSSPMHLMHGLRQLNLSDAQEDKIFDIMHAQAPTMRTRMRALRNSENELQALKTSPDYSEAKARQLIEQITQKRAEMELSRLQAERKVLDVLTPEQRQSLAEMKPGKPRARKNPGE